VGNDFGVGIGGEHVALGGQFLLDLREVLDDAVMHHRQACGNVRVGIALARHAVRGPARVGDAGVGREALGGLGQFDDAADAAQALEVRIEYCQTGRVVTAIFEAGESFDQDEDDILAGDGRDDAAHVISPSSV
jgi:hypothetical protein